MNSLKIYILYILLLIVNQQVNAQIVLIGDNAPYANMNDGNFETVRSSWRQGKQSPFWKTQNDTTKSDTQMGLDIGRLFCSNDFGIAVSKILNTNPSYQTPKAGDIITWSFGADLEYICKGTISLSLVFGEQEHVLAEKVKLIGADKKVEHFEGTYSITQKDALAGLPFIRAAFYSEQGVKVYLDYVNISIVDEKLKGPELTGEPNNSGNVLHWKDKQASKNSKFYVYRQLNEKEGYKKISETTELKFVDRPQINGLAYTYLVTRFDQSESGASNKVVLTKFDKEAPAPPSQVKTEIEETEVKVIWTKSIDNDVDYYSVVRGDANKNYFEEIASHIQRNSYLDFTPIKNTKNTYMVYAHDYSGNKSVSAELIKARINATFGASFSDLILPMPIQSKVRTDLWGAPGVLPRDPKNGIEDPQWSYWGGRPVEDKDGKYHMLVTRWPANALKGHWEWPNSTVAYTVADKPTGPYKVVRNLAYNYHDGLGHNPDIVLLNDSTYMLYSLVNWKASLFKSKTMQGPWEMIGEMTVDWQTSGEKEALAYRYYRNLSGVQLADGRFLFVTKAGEMMISQDQNPLGPYKVISETINGNEIIPEKYRNSNYEDPVLWKDEVQYHMIINAFLDYRAIYLRSPDGIHWVFNPGTAYTPNNTWYEDGTQNHWDKLERPHVLQDKYGRATHLSLAAVDVPKEDDLPGDNHNSKNLILPLVVAKRLKMLNTSTVTKLTKSIKILILSETGFDAQKDIDLSTLRFGAPSEVDFGRGCKVCKSQKKGKDLMLEFNGEGNGITADDFVCKLLGKTTQGNLIIGYSTLINSHL